MHKTKLIRKETVADGTLAFYLEKPEGFVYEAGQHAYVSFPKQGFFSKPLQRIFSFVTAPVDQEIGFATRMRTESEFKMKLKDYAEGGEMTVDGPYGDMLLPAQSEVPVVMLAGGIGITPFFSMIKQSTAYSAGHDITLYYSNRNLDSTAFLADLQAFQNVNSRFKLVATMTDPNVAGWSGERGYIDSDMIKRYNPNWQQARYYLAGPFAMVKTLRELLGGLGIPARQMQMETFTGY